MGDTSALVNQPPQQSQLAEELRVALGRTPPSLLSDWGKRAAKRLVSVGVKRFTGFGSLLATITALSADELVRAISALNDSTFGAYTNDRIDKAQQFTAHIAERGQSAFDLAAQKFESRPSEAATHLLAVVVGFYCGSGGDGDGGIPDLDFLAGVGAHRSIFTHSIIAGTFIEAVVMALVDLIQVVHAQLPAEHSDFWDAMLRHAEIGGSTFVSGASIGIATHLGVDTLLDGFTPYKDLPIELPQFAHELLMGLNAGMESAHGVRRYGQDLWQLRGEPPAPESDRVEAVVISDAEQAQPIRQIPSLDRKMNVSDDMPGSAIPDDEYSPVVALSDRVGRLLGIDTSALNKTIELARTRISQANGPFCLGLVGEFRVGKSTLINALLGQEVAFTDLLEATPVICRFVKSPRLGAAIISIDGQVNSMSVEECNSTLAQRRYDREWAASIERVEYQVPTDVLDSFDLWDAPGLGGSEENDLVAQHYVAMLGGAIWVMDATLVGKAAIANPIARMHADGKPIVCVLNRIDEVTNEDPETLRGSIARSYPGVFAEIVTFSAQTALDSAADGVLSSESVRLWDVIKQAIGASAGAGNITRTLLTKTNFNTQVAAQLQDLKRNIQDRIGALEHFRSGLDEAKRQTLKAVAEHLEQRAESVFAELESRVEGKLAQSSWSPRSIDEITSLLSDSKMLSEISRRVADEALTHANNTWLRISEKSLALSAAAVPMDNSFSEYKVNRPSQTRDAKATDHGVYIGGMTAIGAATIAMVSTIVTWPVILAAIPVGALAAWKKRKEIRASELELKAEIAGLISQMKRAYIEQTRPEVESRIEAAIQQQVERYLADKRRILLNSVDPIDATDVCGEVQAMAEVFHKPGSAEARTEWSGTEVVELLKNPGSRLDIVTQDLDFSLSPVLTGLPNGTEVRVILNAKHQTRDELEKRVGAAFDNWPGRKRVKAISSAKEITLRTILMTQDRCLVSEGSLGQLLESATRFREFQGGRLAGQHLFGGLWEGHPYGGVPIEVSPVH